MSTEAAPAGAFGVWDVYFGRPAPPDGGVNWEAYSHEELHHMLWQDADVADVSTIAADWSEHRAALVNHAAVLREQRGALLEGWQGHGAEEAATRLAALADRVEKIAELAGAGERAAEQAANALARARAAMPPPPGDAAAPTAGAAGNWSDVTSGSGRATGGGGRSPAIGGETTASSAFSAVGGAQFSFYVGAGTTDLRRQQAVQAMRTYESSLTDSTTLIGQARGTIPPAASSRTDRTTASSAATPEVSATKAGARPSWQSLVGGAHSGGEPARGAAAGAVGLGGGVAGGALASRADGLPARLAAGIRAGALTLPGSPAASAQSAAEAAAARAGSPGGMAPPQGAARRDSGTGQHTNQLPTIDHALFPLQEPATEAVIGLPEQSEEGQ